MATTTARDIIKQAMKKVNILAAGETATAEDLQDSFDILNNMISDWSIDNTMIVARTQESANITANTANITIGSNQTWDTTKPFSIVSSFIREANTDYPVEVVSRRVFDSVPDKTTSGRPRRLFYDRGQTQQANQSGTINLYPVSDGAYTLFITSDKGLDEFDSISSNMTFPRYYKRALIYNLAVELACDFDEEVSPKVAIIADESRKNIMRLNARNKIPIKGFKLPGQNDWFNIYTGDV